MQQHPRQPARRRLTQRQIEQLRRRRRKETIISISLLALFAALVITFSVLLVRSLGAKDRAQTVSAAQPTVAATLAPTPTVVVAAEATAAEPTPDPTPAPAAELRTVRLRVVGDIMVTEEQLAYAKAAGGGSYSFMSQFALISDSLQDADYTIANLETTLGKYNGKAYSGYPNFNSPETLLDAVRGSGVDLLTLANNHMLDRWFDGMKNTVNVVEAYGFDHVGAYRTQAERNTPMVVDIGGIKFGFIAYTQYTNGMEKSSDAAATEYGVPFLKTADFAGDIARLREAGAEIVIALPHWGTEYVRQPDDTQKQYAYYLAKAGADIILGSHSHVVQPVRFETLTESDGSTRPVLVAYSLGNFLSTHYKVDYTDSGIILEFTVSEQPDGTFAVENVGYVPTYCWRHDNDVQVLSSAKYLNSRPSGMDNATYARMQESYNELTSLMDGSFAVLTD